MRVMMCQGMLAGVASLTAPHQALAASVLTPQSRQVTVSMTAPDSLGRRAALTGGLLGASTLLGLPLTAAAQIESVNPANNYYVRTLARRAPESARESILSARQHVCASAPSYQQPQHPAAWAFLCSAAPFTTAPPPLLRQFPMAKYRYLPRILKSWIAIDQLAPVALDVGDWEGLQEVVRRVDDATTALPLYTNAVEGSRSGKRKKKSNVQKQMIVDLKDYNKAIEDLQKAVDKKDVAKARKAIAEVRAPLLSYRQLAQIDGEDGGVIQMPLGNAEEVCSPLHTHFAAPLAAPLATLLGREFLTRRAHVPPDSPGTNVQGGPRCPRCRPRGLLTRLLTRLLAYLLTRLLAYLLTCLLAYLLTCLPAYLLTCLLAYLLTCLLAYLLTCLLAGGSRGSAARLRGAGFPRRRREHGLCLAAR